MDFKKEFPDGWKETPLELLVKRLGENGFTIKEKLEVADVDDSAPGTRTHADVYIIERDGREFRFLLGATTNFRDGSERLDGIGWFKPSMAGRPSPIKFEQPADRAAGPMCAAVEHWVRDVVNLYYGKPAETNTAQEKCECANA